MEEKSTNIRREFISGTANYFTIIYIVMLVPEILIECFTGAVDANGGINMDAVVLNDMTVSQVLISLTSIAFMITGLASFLLGIKTNMPLVQGPSVAIATLVTYTLCKTIGYSYFQSLAIVFISGIIFFILSVTGIEEKIHSIIPQNIKFAVSAGIGLLLFVNGFFKAHILENTNNGIKFINFYDFNENTLTAIVAVLGIVFIIVLLKYNVHGAVFIGKLLCIAAAFPLGLIHRGHKEYGWNMLDFFWKLDFSGLFINNNFIVLVVIIFAICIMDIFETISVYISMDYFVRESHIDHKNREVPEILEVDAVNTVIGSVFGMTNVSTYAESSVGIIDGGRSGLTAVITGMLYVLSVPFTPLISFVPSAATATTLMAVGIMMIGLVRKIDFENVAEVLPAITTMILMPLTGSILIGISVGIILYILIHLFLKKAEKISISLIILGVLFAIMLFFLPK